MSRARVLFLTCHLPFPPLSGGRRRELELIRRLAERFDLHLLVASKTIEEDHENACHLRPYCRDIELFPVLPLPADPEAAGSPLQVLRHRSPELSRRVGEILASGDVDVVHAEGFYMVQHLPAGGDVPVLLVEQNVEYELWRQRAELATSAPRRRDLSRQERTTREAEIEAWGRADLLAVLTADDQEEIGAQLPGADVRLVPDGSDHLEARTATETPLERAGPLLVFVANFAYEPNVDAADHLCEEILPRVRSRVPDAHLWLVGNAPPAAVSGLAAERVRVTGRVPDVVPYLDAADVVVCPLRIGGGMKVKALEALQRGSALVSTSIGIQGFPAWARDLLAVADDPATFADLTVKLLRDPNARERAERNSASVLARLPTWDEGAEALGAAYRELIGEPPRVEDGSIEGLSAPELAR